jgi:hypothetical protein
LLTLSCCHQHPQEAAWQRPTRGPYGGRWRRRRRGEAGVIRSVAGNDRVFFGGCSRAQHLSCCPSSVSFALAVLLRELLTDVLTVVLQACRSGPSACCEPVRHRPDTGPQSGVNPWQAHQDQVDGVEVSSASMAHSLDKFNRSRIPHTVTLRIIGRSQEQPGLSLLVVGLPLVDRALGTL